MTTEICTTATPDSGVKGETQPISDRPPAGTNPVVNALPGARVALALLLFINMFNYIDRQVLAAVEPAIEKEMFPNGGTYVEFYMGLLSTAFMVSYMLMAPVFGLLADRMSRWSLIGIGVIVWSLASGASGLASIYLLLLLTRGLVGVGEAAYGPAAPAVISDLYPVSRRGSVLAWFYVAIPVGSALGYVLGGEVMNWTGDWRWAFYVVVPPGILLGVLCFLMREPPRGKAETTAVTSHPATRADYLLILKTPSYILATLGATAMCFAVGGIGYWMPRYFHLNRGMADLAAVNRTFGAILVVAGLLATLLGGWAGDLLRKRMPGSYFWVSGMGMILGFPLLLAVLVVDLPWAWVFVFLTIFWLFFNTGPINTILANVTHPSVRASAFALNILIIHLFGDAFSPPIIGFIAGQARAWSGSAPGLLGTWLGSRGGMDFSFCVVSLLILVAGILWLWGGRYLAEDTALAPTKVADRGAPPA